MQIIIERIEYLSFIQNTIPICSYLVHSHFIIIIYILYVKVQLCNIYCLKYTRHITLQSVKEQPLQVVVENNNKEVNM